MQINITMRCIIYIQIYYSLQWQKVNMALPELLAIGSVCESKVVVAMY